MRQLLIFLGMNALMVMTLGGPQVMAGDKRVIDYTGVNLPHDIGDQIRALEDPNYAEFLAKKAQKAYEQERKAAWMRAERQRRSIRKKRKIREQVRWRGKQKRKEVNPKWIEAHEREKREAEKNQLRLAKEHQKSRAIEEQDNFNRQLAILKKLKASRLPASLPPERVDRRRRRF